MIRKAKAFEFVLGHKSKTIFHTSKKHTKKNEEFNWILQFRVVRSWRKWKPEYYTALVFLFPLFTCCTEMIVFAIFWWLFLEKCLSSKIVRNRVFRLCCLNRILFEFFFYLFTKVLKTSRIIAVIQSERNSKDKRRRSQMTEGDDSHKLYEDRIHSWKIDMRVIQSCVRSPDFLKPIQYGDSEKVRIPTRIPYSRSQF